MRFIDGYWRVRPGVTLEEVVGAHDVAVGERSLTVHAPVAPIRGRGDTLKGPVLDVELSAPAPDVVRVCVTHLAGAVVEHPRFELTTEEGVGEVEVDDTHATLRSGGLEARVARTGGWELEFRAGGRRLTRSEGRGTAIATTQDGAHRVLEQLQLAPGEHVYGFGERFTPFVKNGQRVDTWNADGGTTTWQAYKSIPFYLTDAGYGVFVDHPGDVSFEVGSETVGKVQFSVEGQRLTYLVVHGPTPKDVLRRYTALTGRPAVVPAWSYGLWLSTSFTTDYDEATVTSFVEGMAERDVPLSVFHFDCFWMREQHWTDFEWDPEVFPDPAGMLARLRERGLRISVWINPYVAQRSRLFAEGVENGYFLRRSDGTVWQWDLWQPGMAIVDFTNPAARAWYAEHLRRLVGMGVDCFKTDFGERIPTDVVHHDGGDPERMHNYYTHLYNRTVFEVLEEARGAGDAVLFARSATAGTQQYPVHWGGDCESTFTAMAESLRGGLSLGLSGFGFWSHDIGGFEGTPDPAVFMRWVAFGLLSSHSRLHGSDSYRVPWAFGEEAVEVTRRFARLKARLMPYLLAAGLEASRTGVPVMRAMLLEFPDDPAVATLDMQYMLGERLLVAPVFDHGGLVAYYVPAGTWTHLLTGATTTGPRWVEEQHALDSIPLLVRPDTVLPLGAGEDGPEYAYAEGVTLRAYALPDGARHVVEVPDTAGGTVATFRIARDGQRVVVELDGAAPGWRLELVGDEVAEVSGGHVEGDVVVADDDAVAVTIG